MGTRVNRRERPALNKGRISKAGMVPSSSQNSTTRFFNLPGFFKGLPPYIPTPALALWEGFSLCATPLAGKE